jgi:hypothetical protein
MNREAAMRRVNTLTQCIAANATVTRTEFKPGNAEALERSVKALKAMVVNVDELGVLLNEAAFDCPAEDAGGDAPKLHLAGGAS